MAEIKIPSEIKELGETLGASYALKLHALGSNSMKRVMETLSKLKVKEGLKESQNSGCQNGQCRRPFLEELMELETPEVRD